MDKLTVIKEEKTDKWDKEVDKYNGGLFMTSIWINCISNSIIKPVYLKFLKGEENVALTAGVEICSDKGKFRQLLFYSGIALKSKDPLMAGECKNTLYSYAKRNGYHRISLRSYDDQTYLPVKTKKFKRTERSEFVFYLEEDDISANFSPDVRRRARKAGKNGAVIKKSDSAEMTSRLFKLIDETYKIRQSKGRGPYSFLFLPFFKVEQIKSLVRKKYAVFYYTEMNGEIMSVSLVLTINKKAYGVLMGTSGDGYKAGVPPFHHYEQTRLMKNEGYKYYNIGGVQSGPKYEGLRRFKESLGAEPVISYEEVTSFINKPYSFLNPLLNTKWILLHMNFLPWKFKKAVIKIIDLAIRKKDRY